MTRRPLHISTFFALVLSLTAAFGVALAMAAPAKPGGQIATAAVQHIETDAVASHIHRGSEDDGCRAGPGDCCMPAVGTHCCGFGAIHAGDGMPAAAILLTHAKWRFPSAEPIAGLDPQGDLPPPRDLG